MADNMIELVASLNVTDSAEQINKVDIPKLQKKIEGIKIKCELDTEGISSIQSQLANIKINAPQINLGVGGGSELINNVSHIVDNVEDKIKELRKNQAKALTDALDLTIPRGKTKEVRDTIQGLINDYQRAFQSGNYDEITKSFSALEAYVDQFRKDVQDINKDFVEMQQHVKELARSGKTFISENDYNELKYLLDGGKNANKLLTQAFGLGGWTKDKLKATTSWDSKVQELNEVFDLSRFDSLNDIDSGKFNDHIDGVIQLVNYLNQSFDRDSDFVKEYGAEIDKAFGDQLYTELNRVLGVSTSLDGEFVELFNPDEVQQTTQEVQKLGNEIQRTISKLPDISVGSNTKETLESAKSVLNNYFEASNIDGEANRVKRAIEDTTGELQRFYVQVERGDKSVETLTYAINEQGTAYEYLGKTIREADNSTDFRRKDITTQWDIQTQKLQQFITNAEKAGAASTVLSDDIVNLKNKLNNKGDTSAMNSFLDDFDIAKAKFQAFNAEARKDNALANLQNRIKRLTADINSYAAANKRAVESTKQMTSGRSFADEWARITSVMAKGADLTDRELKDLSADMAVFRKEAQAAGLAGESAFGKFLNSFKTMSSYITANMVFNFVKRQLRDMVQEVTTINTAMTELRKVTTASDEEFERFAKSAGKTGRELGASISDVINATATFARLGYSLTDSEELGRVATLYKNVGDGISEETAAEDIVSTMKAFNIEAKNSIEIVDKLNQVGNNFAISSGGIGEALKRSASALAAGNNDLSQSIALITTANTVAQDPATVGQGIKTVSLRLRSTKTELEEMGEDAEGAAESVSKLRAQMLALTGVDIQLDDSTYKSTYQILLEISKVWGNLNDISRASVLEQLFGKRQANIGAAILENGELLQQVYETAEDSAGSAMREQEEYAKSIQYSIDTLKAAYQDFAQTVINSDFVKNLLGTAQSLLEILTKIIDKVGTLPALLSAIYTARYIKSGKGIFGTVVDETDKANRQITIFGTKVSEIKANLNSVGTSKLSAVGGIFDSLKLKAIGTEIAVTALNAAISMGLSLAISYGVEAISKWVNAEKEAAKEAEELRQKQKEIREQGVKNIENYEQEAKTLNNVISQYVKLISSVQDVNSIKKELTDLQEQIVSNYGREKDGIDLVNKSLEKNIELSTKQQELDNKKYLRDNYEEINEALRYFNMKDIDSLSSKKAMATPFEITKSQIKSKYGSSNRYDEVRSEAKTYYETVKSILSEEYAEVLDYIDFQGEQQGERYGEVYLNKFALGVKEGLTAKQQYDAVQAIVSAYEKTFEKRSNLEYFDTSQIMQNMYDWLAGYENAYKIIEKTQEITSDNKTLEALFDDTKSLDEYKQLIAQVTELQAKLSDSSTSVGDRLTASRELRDTISKLQQIAVQYPVTADTIESALNGIGVSFSNVSTTVENAKEAWIKSLDEAQKGVLSNVDKIKSAMQKLTAGDTLDPKTAWEIINLDDSNILSNIRMTDSGEYILDLEQIVKLKDEIIQKEIETRKESIETAQAQVEVLKNTIASNESYLFVLKAERDAIVSFGINSATQADQLNELNSQISQLESLIESDKTSMDGFNYTIRNETLYINELERSMGNLTNTAEMLKANIEKLKKEVSELEKEAEGQYQAQLHVIDGIIDKHQKELDALEKEKDVLNEQLDALEKQKDSLEETIENYRTVSNYVSETIEKQIKEVEDSRDEVEEYYDNLINKLKEENDERQAAIDKEEKLNALRNAQNNKVRYYDGARGWTYGVDQDALKKAQNDLDALESEEKINKLEKEKEDALKPYEDRIKSLEEYATAWKESLDFMTEAENERLTNEILGADWREKIKNQDYNTITTFQNQFRNYNTQLNTLVNTEIKKLQESVSAKDKEIKAKKEQIKVWQDYKATVQDAATTIKNGLEEYNKYLDSVTLNENSTNETRITNLQKFATTYEGIISKITAKNKEIEEATAKVDSLSNTLNGVQELMNGTQNKLSWSGGQSGGMWNGSQSLGGKLASATGIVDRYSKQLDKINENLNELLEGGIKLTWSGEAKMSGGMWNGFQLLTGEKHASGGLNTHTGYAWMDGTATKPELVLNNVDTAKLYNWIHTMSASQFKPNSSTTKTSNAMFNVQNLNVNGVQNPAEFTRELEKFMNRYWTGKLTESRLY